MENKVPFRVVRGIENNINQIEYKDGQVYFATDTKKIYLDTNQRRIPMGGNTGIYYGKASQPDVAEEFFFYPYEIEDELIPNVKDLIINTDGCFYKVEEIRGEVIKTSRLTIAGTGGSIIEEKGEIKLSIKDFSSYKTILAGKPFELEFTFSATDKDGNVTGPGRYEVWINNIKRKSGRAVQGKNTIELGEFFTVPNRYDFTLMCFGNIGLASDTSTSLYMEINSTDFTVEWNHKDSQVYYLSKDFTMNWNVSVDSDEKTSYILIDDTHAYETDKTSYTITKEALASMNLKHGAHKFELYTIANIDNDLIESDKVIKNIMFWDDVSEEGDPGFIVNCNYFNTKVTQYDTIQIPVMIYHPSNINGTAHIDFKVDGNQKASKKECKNGEWYTFSYTPDKSGLVLLQFFCGTGEASIILDVEALALDIQEVDGYAFKFKATEFATDEEIKNWSFRAENGTLQTIQFSDNFDWINGGLKSGEDDVGPYFKIQAGSYITIPYKIFSQDLKNNGACFKMIFKAFNCRDYDASVIECTTVEQYEKVVVDDNGDPIIDPETGKEKTETVATNVGLNINAQNSRIGSRANELVAQYCEDTYIEYEFDVCKYSNNVEDQYLTIWIDGIPAGVEDFSNADSFRQITPGPKNLKIGSEDCDVYIYLIKFYNKHLTSQEHLQNFIMDAPNSTEMMARFTRNNILTKDSKQNSYISPELLAEKNPDCNVYVYELPSIPTAKLDESKGQYLNGFYYQLKGSREAINSSEVKVGAQGTSSMSYGVSAYNLDTKFPEKWSMDEYAIPVNYYNTKVNVASCESANNALNQEWYNRHQPYKTQKRLQQRTDGKIARDTMQFQNGVVFIKDTNKNTNNSSATANNVFKEIPGYVDNPYPRMYSVGNMGNSKENVEVFHGAGNNYECCVEVADNNTDAQRMIIIPGFYSSSEININGENVKVEGHEISLNLPDEMFDQDGFVIANANWGKTLDPYLQALGIPEEQCYVDNAAMWKNSLIGKKYFKFRYCVNEDNFNNNKVSQEFNSFTEYQQDLSNRFLRLLRWFALNNPSQATNNPLPSPIKFEDYTIKGVKATTNYTNYNSNDEVLKGTTIAGGEYTNDTSEYRVAKMLRESENYLILDSVLYHYIFIERHTMVDNVAKNTFWNTEDGKHWELTKNYDNDTADGVDNSGHLVYNYGIEIMDNDEKDSHIFNARPSAWLHFAHGLKPLREKMYQYLNAKTGENDWKADAYLKLFEDWQRVIPEICWIEDFNRKYFRPNNVYGDKSYLARLANGKKTHQRKQYETYQEQYTSSEYKTSATEGSLIQWRSKQPEGAVTEEGKYEIKGKVKLYASGYLTIAIAQGGGDTAAINIHIRGKKGEEIEFSKIQGSPFNDATCYVYTPNLYQEFTEIETLYPLYFTATDAKKLRKISLIPQTEYQKVRLSDSLSFGTNVEEIIINDCTSANFDLDLTACPRLKILNTAGSAFTGYSIADGAPLTEFIINNPSTLALSNLYYLTNFNIKDYNRLGKIEINNIDYNNINSINIIDEIKKLNKNIEYILTNVNWTFDSGDGITDTSIPILDYLTTKGLTIKNRKQEESLVGVANIPNSAYSGANALTLYNKYGLKSENDSTYPNLTLNFLNDNGTKKLYTVTIVNGDGEKKWSRQYANFDSISNSDLTLSSLGALSFAETIKKQDTSNTVYTFGEKWTCKINNKEYEIKGTDPNSFYLDLSQLKTIIADEGRMQDIIIEPYFEESIKFYTVSFRDRETGEEFYKINNVLHNASFEDVKPPQVPIKDDSNLALTQTYRLKGYTTSKTGSNPSLTIEETWRLQDNTIFYPVFEEASVYDINYGEYLNIGEETRTIDGIRRAYKVLYGIKQKDGNYIYQGNKIVIPAEVEIIDRSAFESTSIKYVFVENNSALFQIDQYGFTTSELKYFDFENCINLKTISTDAFKAAKLDGQYYTDGVIKLPVGLKSIGSGAFNNAISSSTEIKFYIPASVSSMGQYAVANWDGVKPQCTIYIGEEGDFSQLEFKYSPTITFNQNGKPSAVYVNFYTQRYTKEQIEENNYIQRITDLSVINS